MNLIEKLGLEKCKQIVGGAQVSDGLYDLIQNKYISWEDSSIGMVFMLSRFIDIAELRTAIANHDLTVSNSSQNDKQIDLSIKKDIEDHCSDIKNHISPNTKVIER